MIGDGMPAVQAASISGTSGVNLQACTNLRYVQDMRASVHYFDVLDIQPYVGRGISALPFRHH